MKAAPVLALATFFYVLRFIFEQFWFFGPALVGVVTSAALGGGFIGHAAGIAAAGAAAIVINPVVLEVAGTVMAIAVGLLGWIAVWFAIILTNPRLFKTEPKNILWSILGLGISEMPIIGMLPGTLATTIAMYHAQIKKERAELKAYQAQAAALAQQERDARIAEVLQARIAAETAAQEEAAIEDQEAANDASYETAYGEGRISGAAGANESVYARAA
ncbi:MAG TPA: hypothetical protein VMV50_02405 [Candidatus Paceibacterota bacterium]|nr:hypothetical protein [Candidatus Paceibacterota bacterium]